LIQELDNPKFATREQATLGLERLGQVTRPFLEDELKKKPALDKKKRIEGLLEKLGPNAAAEELRWCRIIDVLEHINTPAAKELLGVIAKGDYGPVYAGEAKKALQRRAEKR
jgi:hypothetical protein